MNIYVGNLSYTVTEDQLRELFAKYGTVVSAKVITDMYSGKSKGFGFVEIEEKDGGQKAIEELNDSDFAERKLKVNEARPRNDKRGGGGGGGFNRR